MPPPTTFEDPRRVLNRHGIRPKKSFSQNFLIAEGVQRAILTALAPTAGETVVELGPGVGTLTTGLLETGCRLIAIERDPTMIGILTEELSELDLRPGDAAQVDYAELAKLAPVAVVGNLPYSITGKILRRMVDQSFAIDRAVLMIQREVRDRLLADPGGRTFGTLTVFVSNVFEVEPVLNVPRTSFFPAPRVDSAVIKLRTRTEPLTPVTDEFTELVRRAFQARRKQLRNSLKSWLGSAEQAVAALEASEIDGNRRPETLTVQEFGRLAAAARPTRPPSTGR